MDDYEKAIQQRIEQILIRLQELEREYNEYYNRSK